MSTRSHNGLHKGVKKPKKKLASFDSLSPSFSNPTRELAERKQMISDEAQVPFDPISEDSASSNESIIDPMEEILPTKPTMSKSKGIPVDEREKSIEQMLFGTSTFAFAPSTSSESEEELDEEEEELKEPVESESDEDTPFSRVLGLKDEKNEDEELKTRRKKIKKANGEAAPSAWIDEDDLHETVDIYHSTRKRKLRKGLEEKEISGQVYEQRLREQWAKINRTSTKGTPSWAQLPEEKASNGDDEDHINNSATEMLRSTAALVHKKAQHLIDQDHILIGQIADGNQAAPSKSVVQVVKWHPTGGILLVSGLDKTLRLFDIDGKKNPKLQSAHISDLPILSASFSNSGNEVFLVGLNHAFYIYDILANRIDRVDRIMGTIEAKFKSILVSPDDSLLAFIGGQGKIHLVSNATKAWLTTLKMNGAAICACFSPDGSTLWTAGSLGEVYVWNVKNYSCLKRFKDEGTNPILTMKISPNGEYMATGQDSGVVNVYKISDQSFSTSSSPAPTKVIFNLTTRISVVEFNHDSQLLAIGSNELRNAFRLVHLPSFRVFRNWPAKDTPLGRVTAAAFAPDSSYLAVGNVRGAVKLFKLHHFRPNSKHSKKRTST